MSLLKTDRSGKHETFRIREINFKLPLNRSPATGPLPQGNLYARDVSEIRGNISEQMHEGAERDITRAGK